MNKIEIEYSEDFRESKIAAQVYSRLRDNGFEPLVVNVSHRVNRGECFAEFMFRPQDSLPEEAKLEKMLKGLKLTSFKVLEGAHYS